MFQCEWLKKANPLMTFSYVSSFSFPTTPIPPSLPSHCLWRGLHVFGFDPCLLPCLLSNFPKGNFQSFTWRDGKHFGKERKKRMEGLFKKRNFSMMGTLFKMVQSKFHGQDIVRKWPASKLGPGPKCRKWFLWQWAGVLSKNRILAWLPFPFSVLFHVFG